MGGGNLFTGIVEEIGKIAGIQKGAKSAVLTIQADKVLEDVHIGDSIAVNGVCLTVTSFEKNTYTADVMNETLQRSSLGSLSVGSSVNLEWQWRQTGGLEDISCRDILTEPERSHRLKEMTMLSGTRSWQKTP